MGVALQPFVAATDMRGRGSPRLLRRDETRTNRHVRAERGRIHSREWAEPDIAPRALRGADLGRRSRSSSRVFDAASDRRS
jgi:hypothetical protein